MMNWWLDRGVDGFRMDVINFISKDTTLPDGPVADGKLFGDGTPYYIDGPRMHEFLQEMHREVFAKRPGELLTVGEMPGVTVEEAILYTDPARAEVDMVFQFEHVALDQEEGDKWRPKKLLLTELKQTLGRWQYGLAETGWNSLYWGNHDQARAVSRFGDDSPRYRELSAKMLAGILHLHRGTPYVYQGEELGMTNMTFGAISDYRDIEVLNHHREATSHLGHTDAEVLAALAPLNRDNARTPVQWDASRHAGFTTGAPWIAVNPNANHINAAAQVDDPDSVYSFYRQVIALRHAEPVVSHGNFTMLLPDDPHVYAFTRALTGPGSAVSSGNPADSQPDSQSDGAGIPELLVLGNFSGEERDADLGDEAWGDAELVLGNYPSDASDGGAAAGSSGGSAAGSSGGSASGSPEGAGRDGLSQGAIRLRPWELQVLRRRRGA
jgi:oligo-1,6-glucosidase